MNARSQGFRDLPSFSVDGVLPPADYEITLEELRTSILVRGPLDLEAYSNWDVAQRRMLVDNLGVVVRQLWSVGIEAIYVDGSFVEDKDHPNDIDGYFECDFEFLKIGRLQRDLNLLEPDKIWTWAPESRRP